MFSPKNQYEKIKSSLFWLTKGRYEPEIFWKKWGNSFDHEPMQRAIYPQHRWILQKLIEVKPKKFLEIGCGFGRNIKYIAENYPYKLKIIGVDFSDSMLVNAKKYLGKIQTKNKKIELVKANVINSPFPDSKFDVVLSHGVLMHIKPDNIKNVVSELFRVTKNYAIVIEQNDKLNPLRQKPYQKINFYTFTYPYEELFTQTGFKVKARQKTPDLNMFLLEK